VLTSKLHCSQPCPFAGLIVSWPQCDDVHHHDVTLSDFSGPAGIQVLHDVTLCKLTGPVDIHLQHDWPCQSIHKVTLGSCNAAEV
jgi:hypothetical protein